ncbi:MAG: hypothetical protein ACYTFE_04820 [Planctomycetota bacterium]
MLSLSLHPTGGSPLGDSPVINGPRHCGQYMRASDEGFTGRSELVQKIIIAATTTVTIQCFILVIFSSFPTLASQVLIASACIT